MYYWGKAAQVFFAKHSRIIKRVKLKIKFYEKFFQNENTEENNYIRYKEWFVNYVM